MIISLFFIVLLIKTGDIGVANLKMALSNLPLAIFFILLTILQQMFGAYRLSMLIHLKSFSVKKYVKVLQISWASSCINCVAPSSLFGEFFRIKQVMDIDSSINKDNAVYSSIYSKIFSSISLVMISLLAIHVIDTESIGLKRILNLQYFILISMAVMYLFRKRVKVLLTPIFRKLYKLSKREFVRRRLNNFKSYNGMIFDQKKLLFYNLVSSLLIQVSNIMSFIIIIYAINPGTQVTLLQLATVIPVGIFLMLLPISYQGLGIGHLAFLGLLKLVGINNGADVFTIYFAYTFIFNLLGLIPLILLMGIKKVSVATN